MHESSQAQTSMRAILPDEAYRNEKANELLNSFYQYNPTEAQETALVWYLNKIIDTYSSSILTTQLWQIHLLDRKAWSNTTPMSPQIAFCKLFAEKTTQLIIHNYFSKLQELGKINGSTDTETILQLAQEKMEIEYKDIHFSSGLENTVQKARLTQASKLATVILKQLQKRFDNNKT